jgi:hypothetical protein
MPELTQLESVKSIIRNLPAKGMAASARSLERMLKAGALPPASISASVLSIDQVTFNLSVLRVLRKPPLPFRYF